MSKRFIDTGLFDDDWFMDLSKDAKLLWVYFITKCDHAGILKLNEKLCKVQTDIKDLNLIIKQLGNRLVTVSEHLFFIPKYIDFQYPGFPNSKVRQQQSAVDILVKYGLFDKEKLTLNIQLDNCYEHDNGNVIVNDNETVKKEKYAEFIFLLPEEYEKLINQHGEKNTKTLIEILNNYKGSKGVKYKSDYLTILNWVIDRAKKDGKYIEKPKMI
jgi:hypothetical protein